MTTQPIPTTTDDLVTELEYTAEEYSSVSPGEGDILMRAAERIRELEQAMRWVPVTERLPERGQAILFYVGAYSEIHSGTWQDASFLEHDGYSSWPAHDDPRYGVTHWMPLPEPPK